MTIRFSLFEKIYYKYNFASKMKNKMNCDFENNKNSESRRHNLCIKEFFGSGALCGQLSMDNVDENCMDKSYGRELSMDNFRPWTF